MTIHPARLRSLLSVTFFATALVFLSLQVAPESGHLSAAMYSGGLDAGIGAGNSIAGVGSNSPRDVIVGIVNYILGYVVLIAVIVIVLSGIYMIISFGNDSAKETAKKVIMYTVAGIVIILLAGAIVNIVIGA